MLPKSPLDLYSKIVTDEFIRELEHLLAVASGRAQEKADFTDKLLSTLKARAGEALGSLPGGDWLASALEYALDWGNALRKQKKSAHAERQGHQLNRLHLRIVLDAVAMEAARRHQLFIREYLDADVVTGLIPFAKTGVERMLEYVLRRQLNLHEAHLLMGLVHGRSGRYVTGYTNTELKVKPGLAKKGKRHTAEGAYSRSGYRDTSGELYHVAEQTKLLDKTQDAKYGYAHAPKATLEAAGAVIQPKEGLSLALNERLSQYQPSWVTLTKADIAVYLQTIDPKQTNNPSLLVYLTEKHQHPIERFFYVGENKADWDLTPFNFAGADLSNGVFNHCVFAHSLNHTRFNNAYLRQADFSRVESANEASFKNAHMAFIHAEGVDFSNSDFTQAHCEYGNFKGANFEQCQMLGAQWLYAELTDVKLDNPAALKTIEDAQAEQLKRLEVQENATKALNERLSAQQIQIEELQNHLRELAQMVAEQASESTTEESDSDAESDRDDALIALQALNEKLLQEQQARLAFERYCEGMLQTLTQESEISRQTQVSQAAEIKQLQDTLSALQSQDETFQTLIDKLSKQLSETNSCVKANTLDIADIKSHIEILSAEINLAVEIQAKDLAALTERVDEVEMAVSELSIQQTRTDAHLGRHDADIEHLKAHLGPVPKTKMAETAATVKALIAKRYADDNKIQGVFGKPLSMDEQGGYVNLQMVFTGKIEKKEEKEALDPASAPPDAADDDREAHSPESAQRDERLSSFEDLFGEKRVLKLEDVFKPANDVLKSSDRETLRLDNEDPNIAPNLLFIQGRAGIGKTTCVRYCANQWSAGKLWSDVEYLFVLTFRGLRSPGFMRAQADGEQLPLWEWVYRNSALKQGEGESRGLSFQAQGIEKEDFKAFWDNLIKTEPHKIAFLMDGLDEAPLEHPCLGTFHRLLNDEAYSKCKVIITSRPGTDSLLPKHRRDVEVVGLTNDNVETYITQFFADSEGVDSGAMMQSLKAQPTLWGMAHIPVTLNLMCGLFAEGRENLSDLQGMSSLYYQMESKLLILAAKRLVPTLKAQGKPNLDDIDEHLKQERARYARDYYQVHRKVLAQLALRGLQSEQIILPVEWLDEAIGQAISAGELRAEQSKQLREEVLSLGLVKYTSSDEETESNSAHLEFMHLTFQEYYAAVAVSNALAETAVTPAMAGEQSGIAQFIDEALLNPHYQIMFWLVMGLLKENPQALGQLFERLIDESSPSRDLIGEYRLGLLVRGIEEVMPEIDSEKHNPHPLAALEPKTQRKLFTTLLTRLNKWFIAYQASSMSQNGKGIIIQPSNSHFLQMLSLSPKVSTQLSLMPDNAVVSHLKSRYQAKTINTHRFIGESKYCSPAILSLLLKKIYDKDREVSCAAIDALAGIGSAAATPEVLAGLSAAMRDESISVRAVTVSAIGKLGVVAATPDILLGLSTALGDEDWEVRLNVLNVLKSINKPSAPVATPELLASIASDLLCEDGNLRFTAVIIVELLDAAAVTPEILFGLASVLGDENEYTRQEALNVILILGLAAATPEILASVISTLQDEVRNVRRAAFRIFQALDPAAVTLEFLAYFANTLRKINSRVHIETIDAFKVLLKGSCVISHGLQNEVADVRRAALDLVEHIGYVVATPEFLAGLVGALKNEDENVRYTALSAIRVLGFSAATPEILASLVRTLQDDVVDVRQGALDLVETLGRYVKPPGLFDELGSNSEVDESNFCDKERFARQEVSSAVENLAPGRATATTGILESLSAALHDSDKNERRKAFGIIELLGPVIVTPEILEGLSAALWDEDEAVVRGAVLRSIGKLGPAAATPDILEGLRATLSDEDKYVRCTVIDAIRELGAAVQPHILTGLLATMCDEDWHVKSKALETIENFGELIITTSDIKNGLQHFEGGTFPSWLFIIVYASLCQNLSVSIRRIQEIEDVEDDKPYSLQIMSSQHCIGHPLTTEQAQTFRHYVPTAVTLLFTQPFYKAAKEFEKACRKQLPSIATDPLMQEQFSTSGHLTEGRRAVLFESMVSLAIKWSSFSLISKRNTLMSPSSDRTNYIFFRLHRYFALNPLREEWLNDFQTLLRNLRTACAQQTVRAWIKTTSARRYDNPLRGARYFELRQALEKLTDSVLRTAFNVYASYLRTGVFQSQKMMVTEPAEILRKKLAECVTEPAAKMSALP